MLNAVSKAVCFSTTLLFSLSSTGIAQTPSPTPKPKSCLVAVNASLRELNASARECKNAKDNVVPLKSKKTNVLYGSADDLFGLSLDRIGASENDLPQIEAAETEIKTLRDSLIADLNVAIEEGNANASDVCQNYTSRTGAYNSAVAACSRARKKTVTLSCNVSLRYSKRDAKAAKDRCTGVTKLATSTPTRKTKTLAEMDATLVNYRAALAKATTDAAKSEINAAIAELTAERAKQVQYFDAGMALINAYKSTACNQSSDAAAAYAQLVKSCAKK